MKTIFFTIIAILLTSILFAQSPQAFKYQAVIRNNDGKVLVSQVVSLQISVLQDNPMGSPVYVESHQIATNEYGIANLNIGDGDVVTGVFSEVAWGTTTHFIKTELDITGNQNYEFIGTSQLLSVPYALYAEKSGNAVDDFDKDSLNEIQDLQLNGNVLSITQNGIATQIDLSSYMDDTDTDEQTLSLIGDDLSISNGNTIQIPPDNDADTLNEIQTLSISNNQLTISNANTINLDADITNEIQVLSFTNDTLYLTNGSEVYLGDYLDNTDEQSLTINGNELSISNGNSVTFAGTVDLDADPINELQVLSYSNDTIYLSQSNFVILPHNFDNDTLNEIQILIQDSNIVTLSKNGGQINVNDADSSSVNEIQMLNFINDTLSISNGGNAVYLGVESGYSFNDFYCSFCNDTVINELFVKARKVVHIHGKGELCGGEVLRIYFIDDNNNPLQMDISYDQAKLSNYSTGDIISNNFIQIYSQNSSEYTYRTFDAYFVPEIDMIIKLKVVNYEDEMVQCKTIIQQ